MAGAPYPNKRFSILAIWSVIILAGACNSFSQDTNSDVEKPSEKISKLTLPPGFRAEHLYSPSENKQGSWVAMTFDDQGRIIASDQYGALYRLDLPPIGVDSLAGKVKAERLNVGLGRGSSIDTTTAQLAMGYAQGLVWAFNSLYVVVNHKADSVFEKTSGFYRLQDTDHDDAFDTITLLKTLDGDEEHGPHSVKLSPDKKSFYVIAGNHTALPEGASYRPSPVWQRDNLLPALSQVDIRTKAAGGWIAKVDSTGKEWDVIASGFRNPFDLDFNQSGDMFTYDSDMEWDIGMPWYRPTRICHVTSGADFGWRDGNGKWSPEYPDNLPPVVNIGQGSPTNLVSAHNAHFPPKYQHSLLAFDWSFGIIYSIHLQPEGASYRAQAEEFISGAPLPLTDGVIGPDGALYFLTGGRKIDSDLYRVYYEPDTELASGKPIEESQATQVRRRLEQFHGKPDARALDSAWPYLNDRDRFIRYAARVAVEHQPVSQWQERALTEKDPQRLNAAIMGLARLGDPTLKSRVLDALMTIDFAQLSQPQQVDLLRAFELTLSRMGKPNPKQRISLIDYLDPYYPAATNTLNRSLSKILAYIDDPQVVEKTLALLDTAIDDPTDQPTVAQTSDLILRNPQYGMDLAAVLSHTPPAQQIFYGITLSDVDTGWTPERREKYFHWFYTAYGYTGGRHYFDYINQARASALAYVPEAQRTHFDTASTNTPSVKAVVDWVKIMSEGGPGRNWKMDEALAVVENNLVGRNLEQGKLMFTGAACSSCHSMQGEGGAIGPDLTQLGRRFSVRDILESIIEPNQVISDQYSSTVFTLKDGSSVMGRLVREENGKYYISQNPFAPQALREIAISEVTATKTANVSSMPPGLINSLSEERLKDLIAYLVAGGNKDHPVFKPAPTP